MFEDVKNIIIKRKKYFICGMIATLLLSVLSLTSPYVLWKLIDAIDSGAGLRAVISLVLVLIGVSLSIIVVNAMVCYIRDYLFNKIINDLRGQAFDKFSKELKCFN